MNDLKKEVIISRIKSFLWRAAGFLLVAFLNWLSNEITNWGLSAEWLTVAGLLVGELTKYLNSNLPWLRQQGVQ